MRRKLIKQGPSTLTISLPRDWVERFGLESGQEIDLDEADSRIIVSPIKKNGFVETIAYDVMNIDSAAIHDIIVGIYKCGLKDVLLNDISKEKKRLVKDVIDTTIGLEAIGEGADTLHLVDLGNSDETSLEKAEMQIFWKLSNIVEQIQGNATAEDIKESDLEVNKLAFFIQRNIATQFSGNPESFLRFEKVSVLENFGDSLRSYHLYTPKHKRDASILDSIQKIIDMLRPAPKNMEKLMEIKTALMSLQRLILKDKKKNEGSVLATILLLKNLKQLFEITLAQNISSLRAG